jgi:hypothetical protein
MSRMMLLWHPDSPGMRVWARVPWWRVRSARRWGFATIGDALLWARREDATTTKDGAR